MKYVLLFKRRCLCLLYPPVLPPPKAVMVPVCRSRTETVLSGQTGTLTVRLEVRRVGYSRYGQLVFKAGLSSDMVMISKQECGSAQHGTLRQASFDLNIMSGR